MEDAEFDGPPTAAFVRAVCDRNRGVGSDGILLNRSTASAFALHIYNPDGSRAEKSGNGLRIFARYLRDRGRVHDRPFAVSTEGGPVTCCVRDDRQVRVDMGRVEFGPVTESLEVDGREWEVSTASVGNPHCVVVLPSVSAELARTLGPALENHARFPDRSNVQFAQVLGANEIRIEIWERGAGYTLASGSSSCAAASVVCRRALCDSPVIVRMPGGSLWIEVERDFRVSMQGPAEKIAEGKLGAEFLAQNPPTETPS